MNELIFNLWAIYDSESGFVYALAGKAYCLAGEEDEKLQFLKRFSHTDHQTAKRYQVASRFQIVYPNGEKKTNITDLSAVNNPHANLFEETFIQIQDELPPVMKIHDGEVINIKQKIPDNPLCVITTLYEDEHGTITPIISASDREWMAKQELLRGRVSNFTRSNS